MKEEEILNGGEQGKPDESPRIGSERERRERDGSESILRQQILLATEFASEEIRLTRTSAQTRARAALTPSLLSEWRKNFSILIHGENRIAWNLLAILLGSGFTDVGLVPHGAPTPDRISAGAFTALALTNDEIGLDRLSAIENLRARTSLNSGIFQPSSERAVPDEPELIISLQIPQLDYNQRWLSESTPHLICEVVDGVLWLGPLVIPGLSPCIHCFLLHQRDTQVESQFTGDQLQQSESSVAVAALAAAAIASELSALVTDGSSHLVGVRVAINLLEPTLQIRNLVTNLGSSQIPTLKAAPPLQSFGFHPECGCVADQLFA